MATAGFPNLFLLYGPNTNLGANSIVYMLESQARYITRLLEKARHADIAVVEVRASAEAAWEAMIVEKSSTTAWVTGCHSWYTTGGRNTNNWPDATWRYRRLLSDADLLDFQVRPVSVLADA